MELWRVKDEQVFMSFHRFGMKHPLFSRIMCWITKASSKVFALVYVGFALLLLVRGDHHLVGYLGVPAAMLATASLLRKVIKRKRPFEVLEIDSGVPHENGGSMPSKHASSAMIIALAFFWVNPVIGTIMILLAFLTGSSRIFAGVHFPTDILTGFLLAAAFGLIFCFLG